MEKIKGTLKYNYSERGDVLYAYVNKPRPAKSIEIENGIVLRVDIKTNKIVGFTIVDFKRRTTDGSITKIPYFDNVTPSFFRI